MKNNLIPSDCENVKKIINYNVYIMNLYLDYFCNELFSYLSPVPFYSFEVDSKGKLKEFVLSVSPVKNERIAYLTERFKKYPGDFFYNTPFHGKVYCAKINNSVVYLGHSRLKRFRRIAEKTSRRIISIIFDQIKKRADKLAEERAMRLGIPKDKLLTPLDQQVEEFAHAERRFIKELRNNVFIPDQNLIQSSAIHDCAGLKVILEREEEKKFEDFIGSNNRIKVVEKQRHTGVYNAINYILQYSFDKKFMLENPPNARVVEVLSSRGMRKEKIEEDYLKFIETSEDTVFLEVIVSCFMDMIESELGNCMHEERLLKQREEVEYKSWIARNVRYITEYMFLFAISGKSAIAELPIKLWEKTLPDTYDHAIRQLWDIPTMPVI